MLERLKSISPLFVIVVVIPTLLATAYFGFFAEDVYVSESRFMVRSPDEGGISPLGEVFSSGALSGSTEESDAVNEFLQSRDALAQINRDGLIVEAYGSDDIFWFDRFGAFGGDSFEELYDYFQGKVTVEEGTSALVMQIQVEAYDAAEAQQINERLLQSSEDLVNQLSSRARDDAIRVSLEEVSEAREDARSAALALAQFRDSEGVIDPELQASAGLQMVGALQDELIAARTRLRQMRTYTPQASQIPFLETQVAELEQEIARQTSDMAGGQRSLSANAARYEELQVATKFAEQQLAVALATLQDAEADARRKQAYLDRISQPSLPDYASYPRRVRNIFATFLLSLVAWGVMAMLLTGIREHRD
ncbi:hypothetical protein [Aurantiacibacter poecillastricola]|uniref:hypothetical protein n=1 Tax=Aurantiacibacter poecillastricola TaxID=3064385 RepID=UPI00273E8D37|nr:hypothetical protein [Aurantiacibacter sp. 219JJ12-13]MDP5261360.1 hypothetical protein [Aurantiacibacter sp. 219JJ12-13]